tara:strand:- start:2549 stop:3100 length:552 start_codon:yes stop_codon:yes gene_type:complete
MQSIKERQQPDVDQLITLFNSYAQEAYQTILVKGCDEPIYIPAKTADDVHRIIFAHGFFSSALHEISHWCIAGARRRQQVDYGYWYIEDGRNTSQQQAFERAEIKPQALECLFSIACKVPFQVSCDNLNGCEVDRFAFQSRVKDQVEWYLEHGLPAQAAEFLQVCMEYYQHPVCFRNQCFKAA